jgi:hypothetical protein
MFGLRATDLARQAKQIVDVLLGAGEKIIDAKHVTARRDQALAQMRTEKACTAGDHNYFVH